MEMDEKKLVSKIFNNSRYFYPSAKSRSNTKIKVGPLMVKGNKVEEDDEMVEIFKEQYEFQFSTPKTLETLTNLSLTEQQLDDLDFTQEYI
jgi:hypothetical protein